MTRMARAAEEPSVVVPASGGGRLARDASDARAHAISDGVWGLQLPLCYVSVSSTNAYLLAGREGWILVDCGSCLPPGWAAMEVALSQAGADPADLAMLVVTHSHADHRGLAADVVRHTGCTVAMGPGPHPILDILRDPSIPLEVRRASGRREGIPAPALDRFVDDLPGDDAAYPAAEPERILAAGEEIDSLSGPWHVLPVPGHSGDQIALWNRRNRHLISADLALPGPAAYLEYGTRPDPHADQLASLDRAVALEPDVVLAGHGRPIGDGVAFLRRCREKALAKARSVTSAIGKSPLSGWEIAATMTPVDADAGWWQRSMAESLSVLEHLEMRGLAHSIDDDDGIRRWLAGGR
jgi:glyoxylase-like metal-dependent hydrolase (beta-lactamase superfamily II)